MPGWSLWLLPPRATQVCDQLDRHISEFVPQVYSDVQPKDSIPVIPAHITLTSAIPPLEEGQDAQAWLDALPLEDGGDGDSGGGGGSGGQSEEKTEGATAVSRQENSDANASASAKKPNSSSAVEVKFKELASGDTFFKRLYIRCHKTASLCALASSARRHAVHHRASDVAPEHAKEWAPEAEDVEQWVQDSYDPHVSLLYADLDPTDSRMDTVGDGLREKGIVMAGEEKKEGMAWMEGWTGGRVWLVPTERGLKEWKPVAERVLKG
ncbi:hypothetical protein LTS18_012974 [Coniosporium uncinatum]|uniref:Uncharacterized protein n=1 Tax=Coniosporium uncinatum TaxID=93489 RepID=A0ACC3D9G9_9PEZI|nr:hypothetical protein LTS18_012974 [Coniosporium uncinatum]